MSMMKMFSKKQEIAELKYIKVKNRKSSFFSSKDDVDKLVEESAEHTENLARPAMCSGYGK